MRRSALCLIALCVCLPLGAQQPPELGEVVVTSTRVESTVAESPSAVTVITQDQIAASSAEDVSGLINGTAGVVVKDNGPNGALQTVSLRGASSEQVIVMVDGVRMNSARDGTIDLSTIPVESIDHIEIVRGAESALWGSSAIGGVVNIITKKATKAQMTLSITNGSYIPHDATTVSSLGTQTDVASNALDLLDTQVVDLYLAGMLGDVGLTGGGSFTRAANGYTWYDTGSTGSLNAWRRWTNADSLSGNGFAGVTAPLFGGDFAAKGTFLMANTGLPGSLSYVTDSDRQPETQATGTMTWKTDRFFTDALTMDIKTFYRYDMLGYVDPYYPATYTTQTATLDLTQKLTLNDAIAAVYGGSAYYDSVISTNYATTHDRLNVAGFLSLPVSPTDSLTITPSARYDYFSDFAGNFSYSLSAVYLLSQQASVRASFGSAYRAPTLNELYWSDPEPMYATYGNANLKPETSYNAEVGASLATGVLSMDASVFTRYVLDNIGWFYDYVTTTTTAQNLNETLFPGAEIHAKLTILDGLSLEASDTFVYSFLLNDGTTAYTLADNLRVPYAPVNTLGASIRYAGKIHSGGVELRYVSDQYTDTANTASTTLAGYVVVDADYRLEATEQMALTLTAKNIFNALYYTASGYPMPPFSLEAGLRLHL